VANGTTNANEFQIYMNNIQLTGSYISTNYYFDFETNGVANTGIPAWGGIGVETNPNPGSSFAGQSAFDFAGFTPGPASTVTGYGQYQYPFDYSVTQMNFDPNATGFIVGWELDPVATPLPDALPLFATGLGALGLLGWRRKRTARNLVA
jgi:hypothetical protein